MYNHPLAAHPLGKGVASVVLLEGVKRVLDLGYASSLICCYHCHPAMNATHTDPLPPTKNEWKVDHPLH